MVPAGAVFVVLNDVYLLKLGAPELPAVSMSGEDEFKLDSNRRTGAETLGLLSIDEDPALRSCCDQPFTHTCIQVSYQSSDRF